MTKRTLSALETLFNDNTIGDISAQDLKDFLESVLGSRQVDTVTAAAPTLTTDNDIVLIDATSNNIVVALPTAVGNANKTFLLKRIDTTTNDVTIDPNGTQTIDGSLIAQLWRFGQTLEIISDNANWRIVSNSHSTISIFEQTADVVLANSNAETTLLGTGQGNKKIKANVVKVGSKLRIKISGFLSTLIATTPTITVRIKLGATTIVSSGAISITGNMSNVLFELELDLVFRVIGSGGTIIGQGEIWIKDSTLSILDPLVLTSAQASATDADKTIDITGQWSAADPANTITITNATLSIVD